MTEGCAHRQGSPGSAEAQSCRLPQVKHASSKCAEHRRCTHRVDQRSVASDWWWGGLQQVPARGLGLGLQLQGLQETLRTAHHCVAGVSGSAGQLGRHWGRRGGLQEVAPADASEATSGAGDSTRRPCDIALKKLLELQRTSGASDCAGLHVKHAGRDRCWLHTELWVTHIGRRIQGLQKGSLATCRSCHTQAANVPSTGGAPTVLTSAASPVTGGGVACSRLRPVLICNIPCSGVWVASWSLAGTDIKRAADIRHAAGGYRHTICHDAHLCSR